MSVLRIVMAVIALFLSALTPSIAREGDRDRDREVREAERQLREAERQLREAERQLREAARRLAALQQGEAEDRAWRLVDRRMLWVTNRARLGIVLDTEREEAPGAEGATIRAVTPGGPADEAGLKAGDVILRFNGERLSGRASSRADEDKEIARRAQRRAAGEDIDEEAIAGAAARLVDLALHLSDGDKVALEYRRGKETRTVTLVARAFDPAKAVLAEGFDHPAVAFSHEWPAPPVPPAPPSPPAASAPPGFVSFSVPSRLMQMELVSLNPDLAGYFDTDRGILVVRAPRGGLLDLKSGDVILRIGDEEPATPANAVRLLRARDPDQPLIIQILRKGEKMTLTAAASEIERPRPPSETPAPRPRRRSNL